MAVSGSADTDALIGCDVDVALLRPLVTDAARRRSSCAVAARAAASCSSARVCLATSSRLPRRSWLIDNAPSSLFDSAGFERFPRSTLKLAPSWPSLSVLSSAASAACFDCSSSECSSALIACPSANLVAISCWFAPTAISSAANVITRDEVRLLLNRSVAATTPVSNAVAICSSIVIFGVRNSSIRSTSISLTPDALSSCQSTVPRLLLTIPAVTVDTTASCKILPWAVNALSR